MSSGKISVKTNWISVYKFLSVLDQSKLDNKTKTTLTSVKILKDVTSLKRRYTCKAKHPTARAVNMCAYWQIVDKELNVESNAGNIKIKVASSPAANPIAYFGTKDLNCGSIDAKIDKNEVHVQKISGKLTFPVKKTDDPMVVVENLNLNDISISSQMLLGILGSIAATSEFTGENAW